MAVNDICYECESQGTERGSGVSIYIMGDPSFFDRMISHLRATCKYEHCTSNFRIIDPCHCYHGKHGHHKFSRMFCFNL